MKLRTRSSVAFLGLAGARAVGGEPQLEFADGFWAQQGKRIGLIEMGAPVGDSSELCRIS